MTPKQLQNIKLASLNAIQCLYSQDYASIYPLLHPDITWINSTDNQCLKGKAAISELMAAAPLSGSPLSSSLPPGSLSCQILYSDQDSCAILCACSSRLWQEYCVTFLWKACREGLRIFHIHASASPSEKKPILSFLGRRAECFFLNPDDILYVEADNICTCLVCSSRTYEIRQSISAVKTTLPDYFLQIHRSFLVNLHYTASLRRYSLELSNGAQLPIPEKKYKWLREYLEQHR